MVKTIEESVHCPIAGRATRVAEIVGPAGAGKTTLLRALSQHNKKIQPVFHLRRVSYLPYFISSAVILLPTFVGQHRSLKWLTWRERRMMIHLKALHHTFERQTSDNGTVTVLDQGPVFMLTRLHGFGSEGKSRDYEEWVHSTLNNWASTLDTVIWLDAPDAMLLKRIQAREKWHSVKGKSEQEGCKFLAHFRASYERTISMLSLGGVKVHRFNTSHESLDRIADKVLAAFNLQINESSN